MLAPTRCYLIESSGRWIENRQQSKSARSGGRYDFVAEMNTAIGRSAEDEN